MKVYFPVWPNNSYGLAGLELQQIPKPFASAKPLSAQVVLAHPEEQSLLLLFPNDDVLSGVEYRDSEKRGETIGRGVPRF